MKKSTIWAGLILILLSGCIAAPDTIRDVRELRQDHASYFEAGADTRDLLTRKAQSHLDEEYNVIYFSVWHQTGPFHALPRRVQEDFKKFALKPGYGENKKLHPLSWLKKIQHNAALKAYPNALNRGITLRHTNLRVLPSISPHFYSRDGDAWAWPFDNLQRSSIAANTPVFVCHASADKSWLLVETSFAFGWIPAEDLAYVDDAFIKTWESGRYAVVLRDYTSVLDGENRFLVRASVGNLFPLAAQNAEKVQVLVAVANRHGNAVIRHGYIPASNAALKPLRFNAANAARIANEMIGEPYGWGGLYGHRDCSSMTRDFFTVFGIWLPRHSEDQVREAGTLIDLSGLSLDEKEKTIIEKGVPYLSLLWRKGHVMLYIGAKDGRALVFHNIWGIRTRDLQGREGRKIIGQAVITTLQPGQELRDIDSTTGSLLHNISAMNVLVPATKDTDNPHE
jgi:hypothetical protein